MQQVGRIDGRDLDFDQDFTRAGRWRLRNFNNLGHLRSTAKSRKAHCLHRTSLAFILIVRAVGFPKYNKNPFRRCECRKG